MLFYTSSGGLLPDNLSPSVKKAPAAICIPAMPIDTRVEGSACEPHREKVSCLAALAPALVAKRVMLKEVDRIPAAHAAVTLEWDKLLRMPHPDGKGIGTFDFDSVREWDDVRRESQNSNGDIDAHIARVGELCYQKGSELPEGHPDQAYKGRHVILGDQIKDQHLKGAVFECPGRQPPSMEAARSVDAHSLFPKYEQTQSDAECAYLQSFVGGGRDKGIPTWVEIPKHRWPASWKNMRRPVVRLILSLYGHPDSGTYWEKHCTEAVVSCGWEEIEGWPGVFWHPEAKACLCVYVDDFKMSSPKSWTERLWKALHSKIRLDPHKKPDRFLGCYLEEFECKIKDLEEILGHRPEYWPRDSEDKTKKLPFAPKDPNKIVRGYVYNLQKCFESAVDKYCALAGITKALLRKVSTPFIDDALGPTGYEEDPGTQDKPTVPGEEPEPTGTLHTIAATIVMTVMYAACYGRFDLLRAVGHLAGYMHAWSSDCDKKLYCMMCYIAHSAGDRQLGFIGDEMEECWLELFTDADFAGDRLDMKSTTGVVLVLVGPNTYYPLVGFSKKQGVQCHSTTEAEVIALNTALRMFGLPAMDLWCVLLNREPMLVVQEDNQATGKCVRGGKYHQLRHVHRAHGVQLKWLTSMLNEQKYTLLDCHTSAMAADISTKHFTNPKKMAARCRLSRCFVWFQYEECSKEK